MEEWKDCILGDIAVAVKDRIDTSVLDRESYISTENMLPDKAGVSVSSGVPSGNVIKFQVGDVLISNIRPYFKKIWRANCIGGCSADVICLRATDEVESLFLYYLLSQNAFFDYVMLGAKGTKMPRGDRKQILQWPLSLPSMKEQRVISSFLKFLDDKIEVNRRINDNLEQQAQALFKSWFVDFEPFKDGEFVESEMGMIPKGWKVKSLSGIADYRNGLAMQKYRPLDGEIGLPVLKIKELGQGLCDDSSELCSPSMIGEKYIVNDGDIIFSWSGTLMVKLWCGGKCGLNQHLFLVDPQGFPNWLVYQWTNHYLNNFIRIAKDKAVTMGHIKRGELDKAKVVVPNEMGMCYINALMEPLFKQIIAIQIESRRLAQFRDTLLPRLMSGELKVNEIERTVG